MKTATSHRLRALLMAGASHGALADGAGGHTGGIATASKTAVKAPFDIVHTRIRTEGRTAIFHMAVSGKAGDTRPSKAGKLAGSSVFSSVCATSLDPSVIGFEPKSGILALGRPVPARQGQPVTSAPTPPVV